MKEGSFHPESESVFRVFSEKKRVFQKVFEELSHLYTEMLKATRYRKIPGIFAISGGLFRQKITYATVPLIISAVPFWDSRSALTENSLQSSSLFLYSSV
jgi:hypothetical protein